MVDKINQIEIGGITYDLQDKKSIFSGTAAEYETIADTIEDGTIVNITDDFVEGETLDTHVLNKVDELEEQLETKITTKEDLMANTLPGFLPDALAVKEGFKEINDSLGTIFSNTKSIATYIPTDEVTKMGSVTLPKGVYILHITALFSSLSVEGKRGVLASSSDIITLSSLQANGEYREANKDGATRVRYFTNATFNEETILSIHAYQSSGVDLPVNNFALSAIRLK